MKHSSLVNHTQVGDNFLNFLFTTILNSLLKQICFQKEDCFFKVEKFEIFDNDHPLFNLIHSKIWQTNTILVWALPGPEPTKRICFLPIPIPSYLYQPIPTYTYLYLGIGTFYCYKKVSIRCKRVRYHLKLKVTTVFGCCSFSTHCKATIIATLVVAIVVVVVVVVSTEWKRMETAFLAEQKEALVPTTYQ